MDREKYTVFQKRFGHKLFRRVEEFSSPQPLASSNLSERSSCSGKIFFYSNLLAASTCLQKDRLMDRFLNLKPKSSQGSSTGFFRGRV